MLTVRLTRTSPTHHEFAYERPDGSGERIELETKSFLEHDLLHFCVETEANTRNGFFGLLNSGHTYAELSGKKSQDFDVEEARMIEMIVGALTPITKGTRPSSAILDYVENACCAYKCSVPNYFTLAFMFAVVSKYRAVSGEWNALPFGKTMTLTFDVTPTPGNDAVVELPHDESATV